MQYLCMKQLTAGGDIYYPGDLIPDGVILPERSGKLARSGFIAELGEESRQDPEDVLGKLFTEEEVQSMIRNAVEKALAEAEEKNQETIAELQRHASEIIEAEPGGFETSVPVTVFGDKDHDMSVPLSPEEVNQVFSVMQMTAEEGDKAISAVTSENVLILLHAADSRKAIKNAAKKQADKLHSKGESNAPVNGNASTGTYAEGS